MIGLIEFELLTSYNKLALELYYSANVDVAERFETYEDYLDSQLTSTDLAYLDDEEMARQLVELGYRGLGDTIRREVIAQS